jgi:D-alanine-D-alanine ligase
MPAPRVLVLSNEPTLPADHPDADAEHDILYTADTVARILQGAGLTVGRLGTTADPGVLLGGLTAFAPDVVFNLYEGTAGWGPAEGYVAGLLELLKLPYTGCPVLPLTLCRSKPLTKQLLAGAGLPTAPFVVVPDGPVPANPLGWPVIVKPGTEDASVGIDQNSVVTTQDQLEARVAYLRERYGPSVLVERFVVGREFNVAVVERDGVPACLPFSEILFVPPADKPDLWPIVSFDAKWRPGTVDFTATPAKNPAENVSPELHAAVADVAKRAFQLVGCRDYARVDFRVDEQGRPFVLEVNPNPCISPLAGLAAGLETARVPYPEFVLGLVRAALRRGNKPTHWETAPAVELHQPAETRKPAGRSRPMRAADAPAVAALLAANGLTAEPDRGRTLVLASRGVLVGAASVKPTDAGQGAFAVEWLVTAAGHRRRGVGSALLAAVEQKAAEAGGRVLLADLSSGPAAAAGRQFLHARGFGSAGEVPEFYRDGYARLTFSRLLPAPAAVGERSAG